MARELLVFGIILKTLNPVNLTRFTWEKILIFTSDKDLISTLTVLTDH